MKCKDAAAAIRTGKTALGIEMGSTRIKAVLIDDSHEVLASGSFIWENKLENGLWTYHLEDAVAGLQESFRDLAANTRNRYGVELTTTGAIGISGMMHGYLPLDRDSKQLAPFLTWRNTNTASAARELTGLFQFNIPLRWSIAQLYQAILNDETHVARIGYITTLAGYIHYLLSGRKVIGIGEASGMFPVDSSSLTYDSAMCEKFDSLIANRGYPWTIRDILPQILIAGENAGYLTETGARLLDPTGRFLSGIPMAPPEGDAGTGMVATHSVDSCTGNVSVGTSIFAMVVLEKTLSRVYEDIDMVTTPSGRPVAMVHCNNGSSELDAWMGMFTEIAERVGGRVSSGDLYGKLLRESLGADGDSDGLLLYNYISGEPITGLTDGRPLLVHRQDSKLSLANFMRAQIYSIMASLTLGMRVLGSEQVRIKRLTGHGGLFQTPDVVQRYLAAAMNTPVTVMRTAGEGGPYGMAILAMYLIKKDGMTLETYLRTKVFQDVNGVTVEPDRTNVERYRVFLDAYREALPLERCAVNCFK